uniref:BED-type domain-containing protein n=1 Tax=Oreochromis aureus TaxID=47969 RepID=A0AAZ1XEJ3_OREAU
MPLSVVFYFLIIDYFKGEPKSHGPVFVITYLYFEHDKSTLPLLFINIVKGERCSFFSWKYGHYFEFLSTKDFNIKVRCTLCVGEKVLSTFKNTTSNLKKHLESQHGTVKLTERVPPSGPKQRAVTSAEGPTHPKQQKLDFGAKPVSDEELKKLVAQYIVEEMLPVNTVDSPSFRAIIKKIPTSVNAELPHRTTFTSYLEKEFTEMERNLKAALNEIDFVSTTADIWTANNRSYMGVTLHWISRTTLERHKVALACRRIRGRHTYDVIGTEIENIHSSYGLLNKVVATVTDNGSNFVKAFQVYHPVTESDDETEEEESTPKDDDVTFSDLSEILSAENETEGQLSLPPHRRCASHTINIICTRDVEKHLTTNAESRAVYRSSTAKCTALWTKLSRSTLASETVEEISKRKLLIPTSTRWNSFFDAVKRIAEIPMGELNTVCTKQGLKCFKDQEYQFLHKYCMAMKPLTAALDILQGDCPYGTLLPTLEVLMQKTQAVKDDLSRMTAGLPDAIQTRFASVLDDKDALLAAASSPKFKLRWLRDAGRRERVKQLLTAECCTTAPLAKNPASVPSATTSSSQGEMDFFTFEAEPEEETYSAEKEVMDYLMSGYDLQILHKFSSIKTIFLKYNTPTPSSAPVERLFSLGGLVLTPKRNRLSDRRFEKLLYKFNFKCQEIYC